MMDWKILLLTALSAFIGSIGQLEFKRGADNLQFDLKLLLTNHHIILGVAIYAVSTILYLYALNKEQLSIIYPIAATSYIFTTIFAKVLLKETVGIPSVLGILFILLGVTLIAAQTGG
ncbi:MAG: EamA family transporter [Candidatus Bathyarchaeum sp.]|nr:MAG: EamA family transporter [Candidatus Bathyarchaeum sp.]